MKDENKIKNKVFIDVVDDFNQKMSEQDIEKNRKAQHSSLQKSEYEKRAEAFKMMVAVLVILSMVMVGVTRFVELVTNMNITSDFVNAQTIAESFRHSIIIGMDIGDIGIVAKKTGQEDVTIPLHLVYSRIEFMMGDMPRIMAQPDATWNVAVDDDTGIVKVYAGEVQLSPRLEEYNPPYNKEI